MKKLPLILIMVLILSCNTDNEVVQAEKTYMLNFGFNKIPRMYNSDYRYYLWASKDGENKLLSKFLVYKEIEATEGEEFGEYLNFYRIPKEWIEEDISITLSIDKQSAQPSEPSNWVVAKGSGNLSSDSIALSLADGFYESENQSFLNSEANFYLKAPSKNLIGGDQNGIWFVNNLPPTNGGFENFPVLGESWEYSAWIIVDDNTTADNYIPVSIGKFTNTNQADTSTYGASFNNEFKGPMAVYPFVGEDFINDPNGKFSNLDFPLDLRKPSSVLILKPLVIISIRPKSYTDSSKPFPIWAFTKSIDLNENLSEKTSMDNLNLTVGFAASLSLDQ